MICFVDTPNLYYSCRRAFGPTARINFPVFVKEVERLFGKPEKSIAYVSNSSVQTRKFVTYLERALEFEVRFKPPFEVQTEGGIVRITDWAVELTMDIMMSSADRVLICSNDQRLYPLLQKLKADGKVPMVFAIGTPPNFKNKAIVYEIDKAMIKYEDATVT